MKMHSLFCTTSSGTWFKSLIKIPNVILQTGGGRGVDSGRCGFCGVKEKILSRKHFYLNVLGYKSREFWW